MTTKPDYYKKIIDFNSDKDIIALREKYKEPTFFEIISKQRSETTYSSFLKWMFQSSSTDLSTVSPLLLLLDVLVVESKGNQIADDIKTHIITRNFKINSIEVETEKSVSSVAAALGINHNNSLYQWEEGDVQKIIAKCQDRIDIFISCDIELNDKDNPARKLQIVIENKIDSGEGKGKWKEKTGVLNYDEASQTERYYYATALNNSEDVVQLYVYLAPAGAAECKLDDVYIQIDYQDIVDGIILPMLASSTLSVRQRFFLEELKTELTFPSLEENRARNSIANSQESKNLFEKIWGNYKKLILDAAVCAIESDIWFWDNKYYANRPTNQELLERCREIDPINTNKEWSWKFSKKRILFTSQEKIKFEGFLERLGLQMYNVKSVIEDRDLLEAFWKNNQRFLLAIMSSMKGAVENEEQAVLEKLLSDSSKRDTTKYRVYYKDKCLNEDWLGDKKESNNGETAWLLVKAWLEKQNEAGVCINLDALNKEFTPQKCNTYYSSEKWFKKLFYPYSEEGKYVADGTDIKDEEVDAGGWDFYKPKNDNDFKFQLKLSDGTKVIMLKMWRKDDLKKLYERIKCDGINVQPALEEFQLKGKNKSSYG